MVIQLRDAKLGLERLDIRKPNIILKGEPSEELKAYVEEKGFATNQMNGFTGFALTTEHLPKPEEFEKMAQSMMIPLKDVQEMYQNLAPGKKGFIMYGDPTEEVKEYLKEIGWVFKQEGNFTGFAMSSEFLPEEWQFEKAAVIRLVNRLMSGRNVAIIFIGY